MNPARNVELGDSSCSSISGHLERLVVGPSIQVANFDVTFEGSERFADTAIIAHLRSRPEVIDHTKWSVCRMSSVTMLTDGVPIFGGHLIPTFRHLPRYVAEIHGLTQGEVPEWVRKAVSQVHNQPTVVGSVGLLIGYGAFHYGHFLIELLPRLLALRRVTAQGWSRLPIALSDTSPGWLLAILDEFFGISRDRLHLVDANAGATFQDVLFPEYALGEYGYHPLLSDLLDELIEETAPSRPVRGAERIFVTRLLSQQLPRAVGGRFCLNEVELISIAYSEFGFVPVFPETLRPWSQQIRRFRDASVVVGAAGSGLHNTLFCARGTAVGVVGPHLNDTQYNIAQLRHHKLSYFSQVSRSTDARYSRGAYYVDPNEFREWLAGIVALEQAM